ncbi:hypothetical protein SF83666_b65780 (plasmid) [Sinorhizobium fredii CCBAU 83666]|nr:hypothetical protein SF83666_b65780 [Sinorhizobium fredii CCBAU 83666]
MQHIAGIRIARPRQQTDAEACLVLAAANLQLRHRRRPRRRGRPDRHHHHQSVSSDCRRPQLPLDRSRSWH